MVERAVDVDFQQVFHGLPALLLLLLPDNAFTILDASDAYLQATLTKREEIIGRGLFEIFPDNPADPLATGVRNLDASLRRVLATRKPDFMANQKYDIQRPEEAGGGFEEKHWSPQNWPMLDGDGNVICIVHKVKDVTEQILAEQARKAIEFQLEQAELLYRSVVENVPAITVTSAIGAPPKILFVSPQVRQLGLEPETWKADPNSFWRYVHPEDVSQARQSWGAINRQGEHCGAEFRFILDNGEIRWLCFQANVVQEATARPFVQTIISDITEHKNTEAELRAHRDRLQELVSQRTQALEIANRRLADDVRRRQRVERALFFEKQRAQFTLASIADAVITIDADSRIEYVNSAAESLLGQRSGQLVGRSLLDVLPVSPMAEQPEKNLLEMLAMGSIGQGDFRFADSKGSERVFWLSSTAIYDDYDLPAGAVIVFRDVTEERLQTQRLSHRARHDALTGLPNRAEFEKRLSHALESAAEHGAGHVLLFIDLDGFKRVNDTGGHAAGDELLRQLSKAMAAHIRERDTLARMGGDEFACLLEHCESAHGEDVARALLNAVREYSLFWEGQTFVVGASIGVVPIEGERISVEEAMQTADAACYAVKAAGRNNVHVRKPGDAAAAPQADVWLERLEEALAQSRFELYVQPVTAFADCRAHSYEVLLRMKKDKQLVTAAAFMPAAERHKLAPDIDRWVIRNTFTEIAGHLSMETDPGKTYFINLSVPALVEGKLIDYIQELLGQFKIPSQRLGFEIPEIALMQHFRDVAEFAKAVKSLGCLLAFDDFANALPAASALKALEPDLIKISSRLTDKAADDAVSQALVDAIIRVGHTMSSLTIAKCPGSEDVIKIVRELGIDGVQGNLVGAPRPLWH